MTDRELMQQALEALAIGRDAAYEVAQTYHEAMAGYRPARHIAVDDDVRKIEDAITALKTALAEPQSTHSNECYKWHHKCAVAEVERLRAKLEGPSFEVNFCARCGKRTRDVHSCTPPPKL